MSDDVEADAIRRHESWLELVAPYLDGELATASHDEMATHLASCTLCQRELARQRALTQRLQRLAEAEVPSASLGERLRLAVARREDSETRQRWAWAGWGLAAAQALVIAFLLLAPMGPTTQVPMVREALADYQRVVARELPFEATSIEDLSRSLSLSIDVLKSPRAQLLGAWQTELRGEPAAALAYRVDNRVVIQYVVSEPLFFAQARVREAVSRQGHYATREGREGVIGWPGANAGFLLVGELPTEELVALSI